MNKCEIEQIITNTYLNHHNINIDKQLELFKSKQGYIYQEFLEYLDTNDKIELQTSFEHFISFIHKTKGELI